MPETKDKEQWAVEFDKRFTMQDQRSERGFIIDEDGGIHSLWEIKDFISDLLVAERKRVIGELYQTADKWDDETPVINPVTNKQMDGVKAPRATAFLRELIAKNESSIECRHGANPGECFICGESF